MLRSRSSLYRWYWMTPMARLSSRLIFLRWVPGFALMNYSMRTLFVSWICTTSADCAFAPSADTGCWGVKNVGVCLNWMLFVAIGHVSEGLVIWAVFCSSLKKRGVGVE